MSGIVTPHMIISRLGPVDNACAGPPPRPDFEYDFELLWLGGIGKKGDDGVYVAPPVGVPSLMPSPTLSLDRCLVRGDKDLSDGGHGRSKCRSCQSLLEPNTRGMSMECHMFHGEGRRSQRRKMTHTHTFGYPR